MRGRPEGKQASGGDQNYPSEGPRTLLEMLTPLEETKNYLAPGILGVAKWPRVMCS